MVNIRPDHEMIGVIRGNAASRGLDDMKAQLAIVQAACLMAAEGTTRATATEVASRAAEKYQAEVTASVTGQMFASLGIRTVNSHGKSRFVLDAGQLEKARQSLTARCEEVAGKLEEVSREFEGIPQHIEQLQQEWRETLELRKQEQALIATINEERRQPSRLEYLQAELQKTNEEKARLDKEAERLESLKNECSELSKQVRKLPSLEKKKADLEARLAEHRRKLKEIEAEEEQVSRQETALAERINRLKPRKGWVQLADLYKAIEEAEQELKELSKQLGEKRSLLERMGLKKR